MDIYYGGLPWIGLELFDAKGESLVFLVNLENNRLDGLAFGILLGWMFDPFGPGKVRDMDQAVNPVFNPDEDTKVGDVLDFPLDDSPDRIGFSDQIPRVGLHLFHAQRNAFGFGFDIEYHNFNLVAHGHDLGRMTGFLGPGHFRDMDQAFDALFQLDKTP